MPLCSDSGAEMPYYLLCEGIINQSQMHELLRIGGEVEDLR
jgi:hypothetical protein